MPVPVYSPTSISNLALAEVPDKQIGDFQELSLQARECRRHYDQCVGELLEAHPWTWALARIGLAQVNNDRQPQWGFAYAVPDNCAYIGKVFQTTAALAAQDNPIPGTRLASFDMLAGNNDLTDREPGWPFELGANGAVLYCDCDGATMQFTRNDVEEERFRPLFVRALSVLLGSRIALALSKSAAVQTRLFQLFNTVEGPRAMANDRQRLRETYGDFIPDFIAVR